MHSDLPSSSSAEGDRLREEFYVRLNNFYAGREKSTKKPWTREYVQSVLRELKDARRALVTGERRTATQYNYLTKYDVLEVNDDEYLVFRRVLHDDPVKIIMPLEEYYDKLDEVHKFCGHGGRDKMIDALRDEVLIPKPAIEIFLSLCPVCAKTKHKTRKAPRPVFTKDLFKRGQVDLIDFHLNCDGDFKWLLKYQDMVTKYVHLKPLTNCSPVEVALGIFQVFIEFGAPHVLQSGNGRQFVVDVIKELAVIWPACKVVHGTVRPYQARTSAGSCLEPNVEHLLYAWMKDNNTTKWSVGCHFIQRLLNSSLHPFSGRSPYQIVFGFLPKIGLESIGLPDNILREISTEEELAGLYLKQEETNPCQLVEVCIDKKVNEDLEKVGEENENNILPAAASLCMATLGPDN